MQSQAFCVTFIFRAACKLAQLKINMCQRWNINISFSYSNSTNVVLIRVKNPVKTRRCSPTCFYLLNVSEWSVFDRNVKNRRSITAVIDWWNVSCSVSSCQQHFIQQCWANDMKKTVNDSIYSKCSKKNTKKYFLALIISTLSLEAVSTLMFDTGLM